MSTVQYRQDEIVKYFDTLDKIEYIASGSYSFVFRAETKEGTIVIIKLGNLKRRIEDKEDAPELVTKEDMFREGFIGSMLAKDKFPEGYQYWVQTIAYGEVKKSSDHNLQRFIDAANAAKNVKKATILSEQLAKFGMSNYFVVQENAGNDTLEKWIRKQKRAIPDRQIRLIMFQLLWALHSANSVLGVVHCDLKPENIFVRIVNSAKSTIFSIASGINDQNNKVLNDQFVLDFQPEDVEIVLIDVGGAFIDLPASVKQSGLESHLVTYGKIGTEMFDAPERYDTKWSSASDMFSIGCIMSIMAAQVVRVGTTTFFYENVETPPIPNVKVPKSSKNDRTKKLTSLVHLFLLSESIQSSPENDVSNSAANKFIRKEWDDFKNRKGVYKNVPPSVDLYTAIKTSIGENGLFFLQDLLRIFEDTRAKSSLNVFPSGNTGATKNAFWHCCNNLFFHPFMHTFYKGKSTSKGDFHLDKHRKGSRWLSKTDGEYIAARVKERAKEFRTPTIFGMTQSKNLSVDEKKAKLIRCMNALMDVYLDNRKFTGPKLFVNCYADIFAVQQEFGTDFAHISGFTRERGLQRPVGDLLFNSGEIEAGKEKFMRCVYVLIHLAVVVLVKTFNEPLDRYTNYPNLKKLSKVLKWVAMTSRTFSKDWKDSHGIVDRTLTQAGVPRGDYDMAKIQIGLGRLPENDLKNYLLSRVPKQKTAKEEFVYHPTLLEIASLEEDEDVSLDSSCLIPVKRALAEHADAIKQNASLFHRLNQLGIDEPSWTNHQVIELAKILHSLDHEPNKKGTVLEV